MSLVAEALLGRWAPSKTLMDRLAEDRQDGETFPIFPVCGLSVGLRRGTAAATRVDAIGDVAEPGACARVS